MFARCFSHFQIEGLQVSDCLQEGVDFVISVVLFLVNITINIDVVIIFIVSDLDQFIGMVLLIRPLKTATSYLLLLLYHAIDA